MQKILDNIKNAVIGGDYEGISTLVKDALTEGISVKDVLEESLIAGMSVIGERFKSCEIYIPEVLISAKAMQEGVKILEPLLVKAGVRAKGKVAIGTVKGDLHDIGKNLVVMMLKGAGFEVKDFGIDVSPEAFARAVEEDGADIIAMSALLTTSMPSMKATIDLLKQRNLLKKTKTLIGGAPLTQDYADEIGADGYAPDASSGVDKAKELLGIK